MGARRPPTPPRGMGKLTVGSVVISHPPTGDGAAGSWDGRMEGRRGGAGSLATRSVGAGRRRGFGGGRGVGGALARLFFGGDAGRGVGFSRVGVRL